MAKARTQGGSSRRRPRRPICGYVLDDVVCRKRGEHICEPRAARAVAVFEEILVHTKGKWARQRFVLEDWQRDDIIVPVFGTVVWSEEHGQYIRRYRIVWIELPRKNGKSELLAGIALILLIADDEESAEIYGAAKDVKQARKVWDVAERMVKLSPTLSERLQVNKQEKKIFDEESGSYYEVVTSDAAGELGGNPHGIIFDEVLTQPSGDLWDALQTGMGARTEPLMVAATTAGGQKATFAKGEHDYCLRVAKEPELDRARFVYIRNLRREDIEDWRNEAHWRRINPALGRFLSIEVLRGEAREAELSPRKLMRFLKFRLNVWGLKDVEAWYDEEVWDAAGADEAGEIVVVEASDLVGRRCFGGLDLSTSLDVASLVWDFPAETHHDVLWRFFIPEDRLGELDARTGGLASGWAADGHLITTAGDVIDYSAIVAQIEWDAEAFDVAELAYHRWGMAQLATDLQDAGLVVVPISQTTTSLSPGTKELERLLLAKGYRHGGHPIARWMFGNTAIKEDANGNIRPDPEGSADNITGIKAAVMALDRAARGGEESEPLVILGSS